MPDHSFARPATLPQLLRALPLAARLLRQEWARGGALGTARTLLRLGAVALRYPAHRRLLRVMRGPTTHPLLQRYPRIVLRHSTPYLFKGASWRSRTTMLAAHYGFLNRHCAPAFFARMLDDTGTVVWDATIEGRAISIRLGGPCLLSRHREGELNVGFYLDDVALANIAFSLVPGDEIGVSRDRSLWGYIGQVQGVPGEFERVREATRLCRSVTPSDLLMHAVVGAARAWELPGLVGVPSTGQVSNASYSRSSSRFDYDAFWRAHRAAPLAGGHALMRLPLDQKPIGEIGANHRQRTRVKRAFKEAVATRVCAAVRSGALPGDTTNPASLPTASSP